MSRIENALSRLQRRHDEREPDQQCGEDLEDHDWKCLGSTPDGDQFHKCKNCGKEIET